MAGALFVERITEIGIDGGLPKLGVLCVRCFARHIFIRLTVKRTPDAGMRFEIVIPRGIVMASKVGSDKRKPARVGIIADVDKRQGTRQSALCANCGYHRFGKTCQQN